MAGADRRRHVLFLARSFPPSGLVSAERAENFARALVSSGWDVTVLTVAPDLVAKRAPRFEGVDVEAALGVRRRSSGHGLRFLYSDLFYPERERRLSDETVGRVADVGSRRAALVARLRRLLPHVLVPDNGLGWMLPAWRAARALPGRPVDLVLATGNPFASHVLAWLLARRWRVPYVLDYRDPWTANPVAPPAPPASWLIGPLERFVLRGAAAVITTSPGHAGFLGPWAGVTERVAVITNGYRETDFENLETPPRDGFHLVYAGALFPPHRTLGPVFRALDAVLRDAGSAVASVHFHYLGRNGATARAELPPGATFAFVDHGLQDRREVLRALRSADLGIIVVSSTDQGPPSLDWQIPAKVFEHLGAGCPSLLLAPPGASAEGPLREAGLGVRAAADDAAALRCELAEFLRRRGRSGADESARRRYGWSELGRRLDGVLRKALERSRAVNP